MRLNLMLNVYTRQDFSLRPWRYKSIYYGHT
jgi:hypothetical protein